MSDNDDGMDRKDWPENGAGRRKDGRFTAGNSGRPKGTRDRRTVAVEALFKENGEEVARATIAAAMAGDMAAAKMVLDRVLPARKVRPVAIDLPDRIDSIGDLLAAQVAVAGAMGRGEVSPDEAVEINKALDFIGAAIERRDLEERITALEAREDV